MSDELIYRVKFEADAKSLAELQKLINETESQGRGSSGRGGGRGRSRTEDTEDEISAIRRLKSELKEKREELAKLNEASRENTDVSQAMRTAQAELGSEIQTISQQLQEANRGYSDQEVILAQMPSTYNDLVEQNRALAIAMKRVPLDDTSGQLENLKKKYTENNVKLKEFDASIGNHQRNVGNYAGDIRLAANALAIYQGPLGPLAGRINSFATTLEKANQKAVQGSVAAKLLATGMRLVWAASFPVVGVFLALLNFFKRSEEGQERFRVLMAQIGAVTNTVREYLVSFGKNLVNLWDEPGALADKFKTTMTNLGSAIIESLVTRVKAIPQVYVGLFEQIIGTFQFLGAKVKGILADVPIIGDGIDAEKAQKDAEEAGQRVVKGLLKTKDALATIYNVDFIVNGVKKVASAIGEVVEEAKSNVEQAGELEKALNRELNIRRDLSVERAQQQRDLQQAKKDAKDRNLTLDERITKVREINKAEAELFARELENEQRILDIMREQIDMFSSTEEEIQKRVDQEILVANLQKQNQERQQSALESENELRSKQLELIGAMARKQFEVSIGFGELELNARIDQLEREGRLVEAHQERIGAIQMTFGERVLANMAEMRTLRFNEQFTQEEMMMMATQQARLDIEKDTQESILAIQDAAMQERINRMKVVANAIGAANEAFFNESKELAVAQTIANTYAAAVAAFKDTPGTWERYVAAASAIAMGFSNVRKILSTKLGDKSVSTGTSERQPNVSTSFGLVDVGTNSVIADQVASEASAFRTEMNPTFIFQGDLDPEVMSIKVTQGSNAISSRTIGVGV